MKNKSRQFTFLIFLLLIIWASSFVSIRYALKALSAQNLAFYRYFIASVFFIVVAFVKKIKLPQPQDIIGLLIVGVTGFTAYNLLLNFGEKQVDAGIASFIINTSPLFSIIYVVLKGEEKLLNRDWMAILTSFFGIAILAFSKTKTFTFNLSVIYIIGAALSQGMYFVFQKKFYKNYSPLEITSYAIWLGTIVLFFFSTPNLVEIQNLSTTQWGNLFYLGVFPGCIAYLIVSYCLTKYKMSSFANYLFLIPFIAVIISYIWLHEIPNYISLLGGLIIIMGILIKNKILFSTKQ
jgi:drug/metabolite transporter (DMT)-like permease